jgi:hypothetical protein
LISIPLAAISLCRFVGYRGKPNARAAITAPAIGLHRLKGLSLFGFHNSGFLGRLLRDWLSTDKYVGYGE